MESTYKTLDEQIEILKSKNVLIKDEKKAKEILLRNTYYNLIEGYEDIFINIKNSKKAGKEIYDEETYFEEIYAVYKFDRDLRNLMFKNISIIETHVKSYVSDVFSKKYGTSDYLKRENFQIYNQKSFDSFIDIINSEISRNLKNYPNILNYKTQYGSIPMWMMVSLISFGSIVNFYTYMKEEDKKEVAKILNMNFKDMQSYLRVLNIIRNISAHGNNLFNIELKIKYYCSYPDRYHEDFGIKKQGNSYEKGIDDIASVVIILRRFLNDKEYHHMAEEFIEIIEEVKEELDSQSFANFLEKMGIPSEYQKMRDLRK